MRCTNCGLDVIEGSAFCPGCGKPTLATELVPATGSLQPNIAGLLCYVAGFVGGVAFLVLEPYRRNQFIRFHAFQSILLNVAWVVLYIGIGITAAILPAVLWSLNLLLHTLLSLAVFILWLLLMYKAYSNERFKLPVIGDLAERQSQPAEPPTKVPN